MNVIGIFHPCNPFIDRSCIIPRGGLLHIHVLSYSKKKFARNTRLHEESMAMGI